MIETMMLLLVSAGINGLVTWGVVKTKLAYMDRDIRDNRDAIQHAVDSVAAANSRINEFSRDVFLGRRAADKVYRDQSLGKL